MKQIKRLQVVVTLAFAVAIACFFALFYPHHLHFQEQYQLFLFQWSYATDVCGVPGGVADYIGRFLTQFFLFAWAGASLIMLVLMGIQRCTLQLLRSETKDTLFWPFLLSFLPSVAMWRFLCDENALMSAPVSLLLLLLLAIAVRKIGPKKLRWVVSLLSIPLAYFLAGGLSLIYAAILIIDLLRQERTLLSVSLALVMGIAALSVPAAWHHGVSISLQRLFIGPHYYRYQDSFAIWAWTAAIIVAVAFALNKYLNRLPKKQPGVAFHLAGCAAMLVLTAGTIGHAYSELKEEMFSYDFMARTGQWNRILTLSDKKTPNNQISVTALNLALGKKGLMADNMFNYIQNGTSGLLADFVRDPVSPLVTSEAYYHLGMIHACQHYVFEAQEAIPDYQKSGRCYKRLAETNLIGGSYEVARKYLMALQNTLFYRDWANETIALLGNEEAIAKHPEYGQLRAFRVNEDFFFNEHELPQMLGLFFLSNPQNRMAFEYLSAVYLLRRDIDSFQHYFSLSQPLGYRPIPRVYQQALLLHWSRDHSASEPIPGYIQQDVVQGLNTFISLAQGPNANPERAKAQFGNTYWAYYFYHD